MSNNIEAILWDMDGVLVDSGSLHYETWKILLDAQGIRFDNEIFSKMFGRNNASSLEVLLGHPPSAELLWLVDNVKEQTFREMVPGRVRLLPGVLNWLEAFRARSLPQVVASSAPAENIRVVIEALGIGEYFTHLVSGHDMPGKPDPAVFLEAARMLGCLPATCLVIEDSPAGVGAARRAGMRCVAVTTTHEASELGEASIILRTLEGVEVEKMLSEMTR